MRSKKWRISSFMAKSQKISTSVAIRLNLYGKVDCKALIFDFFGLNIRGTLRPPLRTTELLFPAVFLLACVAVCQRAQELRQIGNFRIRQRRRHSEMPIERSVLGIYIPLECRW